MLTGVDHIAFAVSDLQQSLGFYRDQLGLELVVHRVWREEYVRRMVGIPDASLNIALLQLPGSSGLILELIEYEQPKGVPIPTQVYTPGNAHMCLRVNDIEALYTRLVAAGIEFLSPPMAVTAGPNQGRKAVYLRDPDGIIVQLMDP
jgi:catechol 2,3-dioxygenase-like lactoylglutathione lyase family enzyme